MIRQDLIRSIQSEAIDRRIVAAESHISTLLEHFQHELDPEMSGWSQVAGQRKLDVDFSTSNLSELRRQSLNAYYKNPYARNIINTYVRFVIGQGTVIDFTEKDEGSLSEIKEWWGEFAELNDWFSFEEEFYLRALRDGETFVRIFPSTLNLPLVLRFIDPDRIDSLKSGVTDGIETDAQDAQQVVAYYVRGRDGANEERVPAESMIHFKLGVDKNVKRGRPILEPILPLLTMFDKWLAARMVLNIVRTSVVLVREVQGSTSDLSRLRLGQAANKSAIAETDKAKMLRPGTILSTTPGVKLNMLTPNLEARDAAQDGRTILLSIAAGVGLPDVFVTEDYSNSNMASTVVSQNPAIRAFEADQNRLREGPFSRIIRTSLEDGVQKGRIRNGADLGFTIAYPPMLKRDLRQEVEAWSVMNEKGIASRRTWALNMGLNPDNEKKFIEEEEIERPQPEPKSKRDTAPRRIEDRIPRQNVVV